MNRSRLHPHSLPTISDINAFLVEKLLAMVLSQVGSAPKDAINDVLSMEETVIERLTVPSLAPPPGYAQVAVASAARLVVTAGAVPLDASGNLVGVGDLRRQAQQTLDNLMAQLDAAGAGGADVLKTTIYVASTDLADLDAVWDVVQESPLAAAASTLLGVALLGFSDQLVEIEAIAAVP